MSANALKVSKSHFTTNKKIIDEEVFWDKSKTIMSKTDTRGIIEYVNDVFVSVSGYEESELIGQPHNVIRHPDMPKVIFKILWQSLKKGENFHAIVKNRAKIGYYYWVITDFEIGKNEEGEITNYFARRRAVSDTVVKKHIEPLYKKLLAIEEKSGVEYSEKFLNGLFEERNTSYEGFLDNVIKKSMKEDEVMQEFEQEMREQETQKEKPKSLLKRFFGF